MFNIFEKPIVLPIVINYLLYKYCNNLPIVYVDVILPKYVYGKPIRKHD